MHSPRLFFFPETRRLGRRQPFPWKVAILGALLALICLILSLCAWAESSPSPESEIGIVGGGSIGSIHLFGFASDRQLDLFGVQYARHSWGGLLRARVDYMAEALPAVLLREPSLYGRDSKALTSERKRVYGADVAPIGVRLLWRRNQRWKPYLIGDGGILYFKDRVLSTAATHLNFSAQFGVGLEYRLDRHTELRLGYSLYHFSNADIGRSNPGLDSGLIYTVLSFDLGR